MEGDPNYQKHLDHTIAVDDEFRERLINELRTYPNIFLICGDNTSASYTIQCHDEWQLAQAVISILKKNPRVKDFIIQCLQSV